MPMPNHPREPFAVQRAAQVLLKTKADTFPLPIFSLPQKLGLGCISYVSVNPTKT